MVNDKDMKLSGDLPILFGNYSLHRPFQFDTSCLLNQYLIFRSQLERIFSLNISVKPYN